MIDSENRNTKKGNMTTVLTKSFRILVSLVLVLLAARAIAVTQTVRRSFSLSIALQYDTVKVGEPVVIQIEEKNISNHDIYSLIVGGGDEHGEYAGFPPIVRDAKGKEPPLTKWGRVVFGRQTAADNDVSLELSPVVRGHLHPGEIFKSKITLTGMYDLSVPGKYTVQVRHGDDENNDEVKSNVLTFTVLPKE
jgi:hypothetical protein